MNEISNKTLAILVVIAILISLIGLFIGRARVVTVGRAGLTEDALVQADVLSDIQIAIDGGMDLRDDLDLVAGGGSEVSTGYNEYIYVAAVGNSRLDISYRASCNLFLYDSTGVAKADACVPAAEDNFFNISIVDASTEHFNDIDTPGVEPPNCVAGGVDLCDGGVGGLDSAVWSGLYEGDTGILLELDVRGKGTFYVGEVMGLFTQLRETNIRFKTQ